MMATVVVEAKLLMKFAVDAAAVEVGPEATVMTDTVVLGICKTYFHETSSVW